MVYSDFIRNLMWQKHFQTSDLCSDYIMGSGKHTFLLALLKAL